MPDRTYSTDEIAAIIERAAERQRRAPEPSAPTGLTLEEIERAAAEAGLDAALVREAAAEFDAGGLALASGSTATSVAERWIDAPASAEGWNDTVDQLRVRFGAATPAFGAPDGPRSVGSGWEWTHQGMSGLRRTVSVSPRGDRTRVRVVTVDAGFANERLQGLATGAFLGLLPAMLLGALLAETLGLGNAVGVAAVAMVMLLATAFGGLGVTPWLRRRRAAQARDARALAEDVARWVTAPAATPSPTKENDAPGALPEAPGSLPLLEIEPHEPEPADMPRGRRTRA